MAEDDGGSPYSDGADQGDADDEFATVVFDEAFVRSAVVREPSAEERQLAAVEAGMELEAGGAGRTGYDGGVDDPAGYALPPELSSYPSDFLPGRSAAGPWAGPGHSGGRWVGRLYGASYGRMANPAGRHVAHHRWHRPVAWILAVVMGFGMVAIAVAAVYRGVGAGSTDSPRLPEIKNASSPSSAASADALPQQSATAGAPSG